METAISTRNKFQLSDTSKDSVIVAICWLCLALFIYTAYAKLIDHQRFLKGLIRVQMISKFAIVISYAVPVVEILVALLLLIPKTVKTGLYSFLTIMIVFTTYIISAMIWEPHLPCHCGGAIEKLSWGQHIWFNLAFIIIAAIALRLIKSNKSFKN